MKKPLVEEKHDEGVNQGHCLLAKTLDFSLLFIDNENEMK